MNTKNKILIAFIAGVGAYFDDATNTIFNGNAKSLYHFAVGQPTNDDRISIPTHNQMKKSPTTSSTYSEVGELMASFTPKNTKSMLTAYSAQQEIVKLTKTNLNFEEILATSETQLKSNGTYKDMISGFAKQTEYGLFDEPKDNPYMPPHEMLRCSSLTPVPASTYATGDVPVEYFMRLQGLFPAMNDSNLVSKLLCILFIFRFFCLFDAN